MDNYIYSKANWGKNDTFYKKSNITLL